MSKKIFNITKKICLDNDYSNKMACTVFKGGKIIGKGINNNNRTSMCGCNYLPSIHAELDSLMNACKSIIRNNNNNITNKDLKHLPNLEILYINRNNIITIWTTIGGIVIALLPLSSFPPEEEELSESSKISLLKPLLKI